MTLAQLKDKPAQAGPAPSSSSSASASSGVRYAAAKFLGVGGGNGVRAIGFAGGNGTGKAVNGTSRSGSLVGSNGSHSILNPNYDGKGTYLIFNVGDTIFIGDLNSPDKVTNVVQHGIPSILIDLYVCSVYEFSWWFFRIL